MRRHSIQNSYSYWHKDNHYTDALKLERDASCYTLIAKLLSNFQWWSIIEVLILMHDNAMTWCMSHCYVMHHDSTINYVIIAVVWCIIIRCAILFCVCCYRRGMKKKRSADIAAAVANIRGRTRIANTKYQHKIRKHKHSKPKQKEVSSSSSSLGASSHRCAIHAKRWPSCPKTSSWPVISAENVLKSLSVTTPKTALLRATHILI